MRGARNRSGVRVRRIWPRAIARNVLDGSIRRLREGRQKLIDPLSDTPGPRGNQYGSHRVHH